MNGLLGVGWGDRRREGYWVPGIIETGVGLGSDHPLEMLEILGSE